MSQPAPTPTTPATPAKASSPRRPFYRRRWFLWPVITVTVLAIAVLLAFNLSPTPGALLIRAVFNQGAEKAKAEMARHAPSGGIASIRDEAYRPDDPDARLDVFFPDSVGADEQLPLLVWIHGGAWISGDKDNNTPWYEIIASHGYTVISLNYSLGPDEHYPTPVFQINAALAYIQQNAARFHADPDRIAIAGDSAGAQLTSQIAALTTNPAYANELGIAPSLRPNQLRGVMLNCGIYDMAAFVGENDPPARTTMERLLVWGVGTTVWAYTGKRGGDPVAMTQMSTIDHVTADFPPTWISGGNGDPLTEKQSKPMAARLESLGVPVTALFWPDDHEPTLGHEYQFQLDKPEAQQALDGMLAFLDARIGPAHQVRLEHRSPPHRPVARKQSCMRSPSRTTQGSRAYATQLRPGAYAMWHPQAPSSQDVLHQLSDAIAPGATESPRRTGRRRSP
ncbi:MAG: alpha/beta hydrolase [Thermomicrobiales bacterium]